MIEFLTPDEILSVLKAAKAESARDWLMVLVAFRHGLRASEVCGLRLEDIQDGVLTVGRLKGSRKTVQPLMPHRGEPLLNEAQGIKDWLRKRPTDSGDALFPSKKGMCLTAGAFWRLFRHYAEKACLPRRKAHPHVLKHTAATLLLRGGADMAYVQQYLGHADIRSTQKYVHLSDAEAATKAQTAFMTAFT